MCKRTSTQAPQAFMWLCLLLHAAAAQENRKAVEGDSGFSRFMSLDFSSKCLGCYSKDKERRDPELVWKKHLLHLRNSCQQTKGHGQKDAKTWSSQCQSSMVSHPKRGWLDFTCSYTQFCVDSYSHCSSDSEHAVLLLISMWKRSTPWDGGLWQWESPPTAGSFSPCVHQSTQTAEARAIVSFSWLNVTLFPHWKLDFFSIKKNQN